MTTLLALLIAGLFGFLWYTLLSNIGGRIDAVGVKLNGFDERLRAVEERLTRVEELGQRFSAVDERVKSVEERMIRWEERFSCNLEPSPKDGACADFATGGRDAFRRERCWNTAPDL